MCDVPHYQVEGASRQETLVSGVVLLLTSKVPCHERDALQRRLTLLYLTGICPVTYNNPHCAQVVGGGDISHPMGVCVCVYKYYLTRGAQSDRLMPQLS